MHKKYYICVTPFFPSPNNWRGAYVLDQVKAIQRNSDYEVLVFRCCRLRENPEPYTIDGITVRFTPAYFMPTYFFSGLTNGMNGRLFLKTLKREGIALEDIAVVHSHTAAFACFSAAVKKLNPKVKSLIQYHDRDPYQILYGKLANLKINAMFRAWNYIREFKYLDAHICISEMVRDNLLNFPNAAEHEDYQPYLDRLKQIKCLKRPKDIRTIVLYNGVDTSMFNAGLSGSNSSSSLSDAMKATETNVRLKVQGELNNENFHKPYTINHKPYTIGCIANFLPLKGHMTLIKAVERIVTNGTIPELKVIFIGTGILMDDCKNYIHEHDLANYFEFQTEVMHEELPNFYCSLDLFALPTMYEGFGCVFTEAAACGVPFMICEHQGASEYIVPDEADRWLIHPNDDRQLADMIVRQYKERAVQHLTKSYDINILIKNYLKWLNS